jgi:hypothetical protein
VVVTDPRTGAILALVSTPSYDPNLFVDGISSKDYSGLLNDPNTPLVNRATQGFTRRRRRLNRTWPSRRSAPGLSPATPACLTRLVAASRLG